MLYRCCGVWKFNFKSADVMMSIVAVRSKKKKKKRAIVVNSVVMYEEQLTQNSL